LEDIFVKIGINKQMVLILCPDKHEMNMVRCYSNTFEDVAKYFVNQSFPSIYVEGIYGVSVSQPNFMRKKKVEKK